MKVTLETERLILRPWRIEDAEEMFYGWANDPEVTKYMTWNAHTDIEQTKQILAMWVEEYQKPERIAFGIVLKDENKLIGGIDVVGYLNGPKGTPVIGYDLSRKYWNHGYMTEACKCVINYLFSLGYPEIEIDAFDENIGSNHVIQKCGGVFIGAEIEEIPQKKTTALINHYIVKNNL